MSGGFFLGFLAKSAFVVDECLKFSLSNIFCVDIFDPRTVECIISSSPKRANQGKKGGLSIKLLECKPSGKESMVVGRNIFARASELAKVIIGGRNGVYVLDNGSITATTCSMGR